MPSSVEFAFRHMIPKNIGGQVYMFTKESLSSPDDLLTFFEGEDGSEKTQRQVYTLILPTGNLDNAYAELING
jgi:hypothetical protein